MVRKIMWSVGLALLAALIVSACSNNGNNQEPVVNEPTEENAGNVNESVDTPESPEINDVPEGEENNTDTNGEVDSEDVAEDVQPVLTSADLEGGVAIGSSGENIQSLLGEDYAEVVAALTGEMAWRFDIGTVGGYQYESQTDTPDLEGLTKGDLTLQVFIFFDEEESVTGYSAYESRSENEIIDVYHLMEDGSRITEQIN